MKRKEEFDLWKSSSDSGEGEDDENECNPGTGTTGLDPITLAPLHPAHPAHPFIVSPDGSATICYLESTLRRIAVSKGRWVQPPHFREPMSADLVEKCEKLGGPLAIPPPRPHGEEDGFDGDEVEEDFRMFAYGEDFAGLLECFVGKLSQEDVNLCPVCYERLKRSCHETDPMRIVLSRGISAAAHFAFPDKRSWTRHLVERHGMARDDPIADVEDCKLKQLVYNWLMGDDPEASRFRSKIKLVRAWDSDRRKSVRKVAQKGQTELNDYWHFDGRYNVGCYNRLRDVVVLGVPPDTPLFSGESGEESVDSEARRDSDSEEWLDDDLGSHPYNRGMRKGRGKPKPKPSTRRRRTRKRESSTDADQADHEGGGRDTSEDEGNGDEPAAAATPGRRGRLKRADGTKIAERRRRPDSGSDREEHTSTRRHLRAMVLTDEEDEDEEKDDDDGSQRETQDEARAAATEGSFTPKNHSPPPSPIKGSPVGPTSRHYFSEDLEGETIRIARKPKSKAQKKKLLVGSDDEEKEPPKSALSSTATTEPPEPRVIDADMPSPVISTELRRLRKRTVTDDRIEIHSSTSSTSSSSPSSSPPKKPHTKKAHTGSSPSSQPPDDT